MSDALEAMAQGRVTGHERLDDVAIARIVNRVHGAAVVSAWDVGQLPDEWVDVFIGIAIDLPRKQARRKAIDQKFKEFEQEYTRVTGLKVH